MAMKQNDYLIVNLLKAFYWFDDGLQSYMRAKGWPTLSRTQSMIIMNVISGVNRSVDIAINLGVTRQAVHFTISQMVKDGLVKFESDPDDGRSKIVVLTDAIEPMRRDARHAIDQLTNELGQRVGEKELQVLLKIFSKNWGVSVDFSEKSSTPEEEPVRKSGTRSRKQVAH